ncbi:monocarboxylate transporter 9-like isoform X5 [Cylas formicarius]|uniref:monocarboxylate transporter 9-like isoform X5 n=1 Tax=Cylas formicarius TaxID=197179 RepID=UPI002958B8DD|nr:monocarboxylate transporter 9-like isoform X5 [Cylas formicarius]
MRNRNGEFQITVENKVAPPDGGWGYIVAISTTLIFIATCTPSATFGLIYGKFLASIGDETTATTLANGFFNAVSSFMGLATNILLNKFSARKVAVVGSLTFIVGAITLIFCENMVQFIVFFGVVQGIGFGLLMPSSFSTMNCYFDSKLSMMMSLSQSLLIAAYIGAAPLATISIDHLGFKGTLVVIAGLSVLSLPAAMSFQPVKLHIKEISTDTFDNNDQTFSANARQRAISLGNDVLYSQINLLTDFNATECSYQSQEALNNNIIRDGGFCITKQTMSVISLGDRSAVVPTNFSNIGKKSIWQSLLHSMDLSLFKDLRYLNISVGVAFSYTADLSFFPIIPLILGNIGYRSSDIALVLSVYYGSDLAARLILSVVSGLVAFESRKGLVIGSLLSAIFVFVFVINDSYALKVVALVLLGSLRCTVQTLMPLVFSEEYSDIFATAFSLFMVVNGTVGLITAPLMSNHPHSNGCVWFGFW